MLLESEEQELINYIQSLPNGEGKPVYKLDFKTLTAFRLAFGIDNEYTDITET